MTDLLSQCNWPPLSERYTVALREAVTFILSRFDVLGIIASGAIIRGNPHKSSDFDIYVINSKSQRQRIQKFFNGVPAEIFVNPPSAIQRYFDDEQRESQPSTAHMLATGFVILDRDPIVGQLRQQAQNLLDAPLQFTDDTLIWPRYDIANQYENALDIADTDSASATMILSSTVQDMLRYHFRSRGRFMPRDKDLLNALDGELGVWARKFYESHRLDEQLELAAKIAQHTIGVSGFFEWESLLQDVD